ncbi:MAG: hypothetical protein R6U96_18700 [Promethearchaeia archaeon]
MREKKKYVKKKVNVSGYTRKDGTKVSSYSRKQKVLNPRFGGEFISLEKAKKEHEKRSKKAQAADFEYVGRLDISDISDTREIAWEELEKEAIEKLEKYPINEIKEAVEQLKYYLEDENDSIYIYRLFNIYTEETPDKYTSWSFDPSEGFKDEGMKYVTHLAEAEIDIKEIDLLDTIDQLVRYPTEHEAIIENPEKIQVTNIEFDPDLSSIQREEVKKYMEEEGITLNLNKGKKEEQKPKKGRGWWGESERHSKADLEGFVLHKKHQTEPAAIGHARALRKRGAKVKRHGTKIYVKFEED